ncbi:hypothetical protein [Variovorax sp. HW608]|uniref:hypothetical protein n=1 Tax=Variovorax sp. HW608 TaxID=1034889 RepID=UPI000B5B0A54|nr:hypothetical protein [Variovorax sp. HW608]
MEARNNLLRAEAAEPHGLAASLFASHFWRLGREDESPAGFFNSRSGKRKVRGRKSSTGNASTPTRKCKAQGAALNAIDEFHNLRDTLLAFECLQGFLSPHRRYEFEEFHVEPGELRALVTCINAETQRRVQAVDEAIESVRRALH